MSLKKIKVLVITSSFPRNKDDWWQQAILYFYKYLDKKFKITVIAPSAPGAKSSENLFNIEVKRFTYFYPKSLQRLTTGEGILYSGKRGVLNRIQVLTFVLSEFVYTFYIMLKRDFDIIHAQWIFPQGLLGVFGKFIFKKPLIVTGHGVDIFGLKKINIIKKFILNSADICTVNSRATFDEAKEIAPGANVKIIPPGVDLKVFNKRNNDEDWRKKYGDNPKIILGVGRLIRWKGFEYLIKALPLVLRKFPDSKVIIIGSGPEEETLKMLVKKLKIEKKVFFIGHVSTSELSSAYASADVFVSPSITYSTGEREGLGNVILEALASGVPVIASRSGGIVDLIDGRSTGLLFEEKNIKNIAKKISFLLSNKMERDNFSKNGLNFVKKNYSWEKIDKDLGDLYESILH